MSEALLPLYVHVQTLVVAGGHRLRRLHPDQRGEGVISAAIAVLVMAFLGALMWVAFKAMFQQTSDKTQTQIQQIGA